MLNFGVKCKAKKFVGGKVKRMVGRSDSPVRNHWLINVGHGVALQSYNSIVAFKFTKRFGKFDKGDVLLDRSTWNYSKTTSRYRDIFLDENIDETRKKIVSGKYTLEALNFVHTKEGG
jgi:hypothetical protein